MKRLCGLAPVHRRFPAHRETKSGSPFVLSVKK